MDTTYIILIILGAILVIGAIILIVGKISSSSKKISKSLLQRFSKNKSKQTEISTQPDEKQEIKFEFDEKKPEKVEEFSDLNDDDMAALGISQPEPEPNEIRRKSFEEIMRNREKSLSNRNLSDQEEDFDDFEEFRSQHSSYTKYVKDDALINQIKGMSPQMRALIISNIFARLKDDDK